jgi:glyoxylase-like metal-dependent hydrolase (beta-lactamase superfamily II)
LRQRACAADGKPMLLCTRRQQLAWLTALTAARAIPAVAGGRPSGLEWRIGNVRVQRVWERDVLPLDPTQFFPDATPEVMASIPWLHPWFTDANGQITLSIAAYLIESRGKRILVDTGIGDFEISGFPMFPRPGPAVPGLIAEQGIALATVDQVVNTHLHADHVGGNVTGHGAAARPSFPNAEYLVGRSDYDYWSTRPPESFGRHVFETAVRPISAAKRLILIDGPTSLTEEVWLVPSPGHTPGHFSVLISSAGNEALITGDMVHHPVQLAFPDHGMDQDQEAGAASRRKLLSLAAERNALLIGSHFPYPTAGRVRSQGTAFRFDSEA